VTNPFGHTVVQGPMNWSADVSLFKMFPITEKVFLRVNVDALNVFNNQASLTRAAPTEQYAPLLEARAVPPTTRLVSYSSRRG
jgi:hypothetical protein